MPVATQHLRMRVFLRPLLCLLHVPSRCGSDVSGFSLSQLQPVAHSLTIFLLLIVGRGSDPLPPRYQTDQSRCDASHPEQHAQQETHHQCPKLNASRVATQQRSWTHHRNPSPAKGGICESPRTTQHAPPQPKRPCLRDQEGHWALDVCDPCAYSTRPELRRRFSPLHAVRNRRTESSAASTASWTPPDKGSIHNNFQA